MDNYMGFKLVQATQMYRHQEDMGMCGVETSFIKPEDMTSGNTPTENYWEGGYQVTYPDGYVSWCPKDEFERVNLKVEPNPKLKSKVSISQEMVDAFILTKDVSTSGDKTTIVVVTLVNGFTLVEASACVDIANYSEEIGAECCMEKIKDKIWLLLGFLLQTAFQGVK